MLSPAIADTLERFRGDPSAARSTPTVTATLVNGHARLSAGAFNWDADLPASLGGGNLAPSPTAYLLGALAGCAVAFLSDTLAPQFGVRVDAVTATARCASDARGLLGIDDTSAELTSLELDIEIHSPDPAEDVESMLAAWRARCPIYLALLRPNGVALTSRVASARPASTLV
ncbi:MAG TPA: OsmC family protein [Candidatus Limnocylindrales bacterium]|nr:OsmC family protein [Candidatus Limnocylindrales bacterium]